MDPGDLDPGDLDPGDRGSRARAQAFPLSDEGIVKSVIIVSHYFFLMNAVRKKKVVCFIDVSLEDKKGT